MASLRPWLFVVSLAAALGGYLGPWVAHPVVGLAITGIDLPEYVKFLPAVRAGTIGIWREGFYLPPCAVSLMFSLFAFRTTWGLPGWLKRICPVVAFASASLLLPPAWTPGLLLTPEFRLQTGAMLLCWAAAGFSPWVGMLPMLPARLLSTLLIAVAATIPLLSFMAVLPDIRLLYIAPIRVGWGLYVMQTGLIVLLWSIWSGGPANRILNESSPNDTLQQKTVG